MAVLVNPSVQQVSQLLDAVPVNILQLHGDESPELCESYGFPYVKAIRAPSVVDAGRKARKYPGARAFLFDTLVSDQYGGTGEPLSWQPLPDSIGSLEARSLPGTGFTLPFVGTVDPIERLRTALIRKAPFFQQFFDPLAYQHDSSSGVVQE